MKIAIITGASSGIGQEFAIQIDALFKDKLDEIWLIARNEERLNELSNLLLIKTRKIVMDVTDSLKQEEYRKLLSIGNPEVCMCVLSAGFGYQGEFTKMPAEPQIEMIHCNCTALTRMVYDTLPYMRKNGRMLFMASAAAFTPQARFSVYAATKAYVLSLGRALNRELEERGITVTCVCPGPVDTAFFDTAETYAKGKSIKKLTMVSPQLVVREALAASKAKKDLCIPGIIMKLVYPFTRILPHHVLLRFF